MSLQGARVQHQDIRRPIMCEAPGQCWHCCPWLAAVMPWGEKGWWVLWDLLGSRDDAMGAEDCLRMSWGCNPSLYSCQEGQWKMALL